MWSKSSHACITTKRLRCPLEAPGAVPVRKGATRWMIRHLTSTCHESTTAVTAREGEPEQACELDQDRTFILERNEPLGVFFCLFFFFFWSMLPHLLPVLCSEGHRFYPCLNLCPPFYVQLCEMGIIRWCVNRLLIFSFIHRVLYEQL